MDARAWLGRVGAALASYIPRTTPKEKIMADKDESFRESLKDCIAIMETLSHISDSPADMVAVMSLALTSDAQLRILMDRMTAPSRKK